MKMERILHVLLEYLADFLVFVSFQIERLVLGWLQINTQSLTLDRCAPHLLPLTQGATR